MRAARIDRWILGHPLRFMLCLVALHVAVVAPLLYLSPDIHDGIRARDVAIFDERARAILRGDLAMTSTSIMPADAPPLVNFLFLPAAMLGGGMTVYGAYFALWPLITADILYFGLRDHWPRLAPGAALIVVTQPTSWVTATLMVQDEVLMGPFLAMLVVCLMRGKLAHGAAWTALGTLVKAWPIVAAPLVLAAAPGARARRRVLTAAVVPAVAVALPFVLLDPGYLPAVAHFYSGGVPAHRDTPTGVSFWRYLGDAGLWPGLPVLLGLLGATSLLVWWAVARGRLHPAIGLGAAFLAFFLFFPKLHYGYLLYLVIALVPAMATRGMVIVLLSGLSGLAALGHVLHWYQHGLVGTLSARLVVSLAVLAVIASLAVLIGRMTRPGGQNFAMNTPADAGDRPFRVMVTFAALGLIAAWSTAAWLTVA